MPKPPVDLQPCADEEAPLGELLRSRALASTPPSLLGQALAGTALNAAIVVWHPDRWGIAMLGAAAVGLHSLWSLSVLRTTETPPVTSGVVTERGQPPREGWWRVRRVAAVAASASALLLLWSVSALLLGRWIS